MCKKIGFQRVLIIRLFFWTVDISVPRSVIAYFMRFILKLSKWRSQTSTRPPDWSLRGPLRVSRVLHLSLSLGIAPIIGKPLSHTRRCISRAVKQKAWKERQSATKAEKCTSSLIGSIAEAPSREEDAVTAMLAKW